MDHCLSTKSSSAESRANADDPISRINGAKQIYLFLKHESTGQRLWDVNTYSTCGIHDTVTPGIIWPWAWRTRHSASPQPGAVK